MSSIHNRYKFISVNPRDKEWGLSILSAGYQDIVPGTDYSKNEYPPEYSIDTEKGRIVYEYQLILITDGKGTFTSSKGGTHEVHGGDMFMLFPGEWHKYCPQKDCGWKEYWIAFNGGFIDHRCERAFFSPEKPVFKIADIGTMVSLYKEAIIIANEQKPYFQQLLAGIVNHMLGIMLSSAASLEFEKEGRYGEIVNKAKALFQEEIDSELVMTEIAEKFNMSYSSFRHIFKKYTGLSPHQYVSDLRIHDAKAWLQSTDRSIKEIAFSLGFECPENFATFFKKATGLTPSQFRKGLSR